METAILNVKGMTCSGCVASVTRVLQQVEGVKTVQVSLENANATVQYDPAVANPRGFKTAIEDAGYEAG